MVVPATDPAREDEHCAASYESGPAAHPASRDDEGHGQAPATVIQSAISPAEVPGSPDKTELARGTVALWKDRQKEEQGYGSKEVPEPHQWGLCEFGAAEGRRLVRKVGESEGGFDDNASWHSWNSNAASSQGRSASCDSNGSGQRMADFLKSASGTPANPVEFGTPCAAATSANLGISQDAMEEEQSRHPASPCLAQNASGSSAANPGTSSSAQAASDSDIQRWGVYEFTHPALGRLRVYSGCDSWASASASCKAFGKISGRRSTEIWVLDFLQLQHGVRSG
eukprot:TRINITY_DN8144_c0_g4_i4.p1 TRINITY_DN8144_c0_g4~~TRINITY_DN8144_c0_g4_i4.p1  ORF type:complete len:283 (-),score=40.14 TRINITY_DN8144_c0_g4_i4:361-1209(-)